MCGRLRCRALLWAGLLVAALCVDAQPFGPAHLAVPAAQMPHERGWPALTTPANSTQLRWLHLLSAPLALPADGDGAVVRSVSLAPLATLADVAAQHRRAPRYSVALRFQLPATVGSSASPSNAAAAALAAALPGRTCALLHRLDFHRANLETPGLLINPGVGTSCVHSTPTTQSILSLPHLLFPCRVRFPPAADAGGALYVPRPPRRADARCLAAGGPAGPPLVPGGALGGREWPGPALSRPGPHPRHPHRPHPPVHNLPVCYTLSLFL